MLVAGLFRHAGLAGADDHGLLEFAFGRSLVLVAELELAEGDAIAMLEGMLLDELAVDIGAVGAAEILEEGILEYGNDLGMLATDRQVIDLDVVAGFAAQGGGLLGQRVFLPLPGARSHYQFCNHFCSASFVVVAGATRPFTVVPAISGLEPFDQLLEPAPGFREILVDAAQDDRNIVLSAILVCLCNQLLGGFF